MFVSPCREKTKKGAFVEVSLYDTALASLKNQATNWLMNNFIPQPIGSLHPNIAPYGETFKTKDGKLLILAIGTDHHFKMLLGVIGAEKLLENKNYANNQLRVTHRKKLATDLNPFFNQKTKEELMVPFLELNIPVGVINNLEEVFENKKTQDLILEEIIENVTTKRIKTAVFKISN